MISHNHFTTGSAVSLFSSFGGCFLWKAWSGVSKGFDAEVWFDIVVPVHILVYASEYECANTAAMNAYVRPIAERYLESLQAKLKNLGLTATMYAMLSSGGYGNSVERDQERVLDDVRNGYMSVIQAREVRRRRRSK